MNSTKSASLALLAVLLSPMAANAVLIEFRWQDTITNTGTMVPGISDGDLITATIIADNGGADFLNQSWFQADVLSAVVTVGPSYVATFALPHHIIDPIFVTDALGVITASGWFDVDAGAGDTDNAGGANAPQFFSNAFRTSIVGSLLAYDNFSSSESSSPAIPSNWNVQAVSVPEPTTLSLLGLALLGIGAARRRRKA